MPQRLLVLNVVLGLVSLVFAVGIVRTLVGKHPLPSAGVPRPMAAPAPAAVPATADAGPDTYAMIATQNLFNPARSETATAAAGVAVVKPILHGVVIQAGTSRAFLEDPSAKRVSGYSVGDTISGGKIQKIADDRVLIARPEGMVEVLLQDPSKPRPAPTAAPGVIAGQGQLVPGMPAAPGQIAPGQFAPGQPAPGQPAPGQFAPVQVGPGQPVPGQPAQITRPNPEASSTVPQGPPSQSRRRSSPQGQAGNE
jgi:Type II secretion system protein C